MRDKTKNLLLLLVSLLLFVGCSKDDDEPNREYLGIIKGEWRSLYHNSNDEPMNETGVYVQRWIFAGDGTMIFDIFNSDITATSKPNVSMEGTYSIVGTTLTIETDMYKKSYNITSLDDFYLDLSYRGTEGDDCESRYMRYQ